MATLTKLQVSRTQTPFCIDDKGPGADNSKIHNDDDDAAMEEIDTPRPVRDSIQFLLSKQNESKLSMRLADMSGSMMSKRYIWCPLMASTMGFIQNA